MPAATVCIRDSLCVVPNAAKMDGLRTVNGGPMIYVIATIELKPGGREEFLNHFRENVPRVLAEQGCIEYQPAIDTPTEIAAQGPPRGEVVTVVEKWEDVPALMAHLQAPHMLAYRERVQHLVSGVQLQVLEPA